MKLLLTDCATLKANGDLSLDTFKQFGEVKEYGNISRYELLSEAADTDIILCNKTVIDKEVLDKFNSIKSLLIYRDFCDRV